MALDHQYSDDDGFDHRDHPLWLGEKLNLNMAFLEAANSSP